MSNQPSNRETKLSPLSELSPSRSQRSILANCESVPIPPGTIRLGNGSFSLSVSASKLPQSSSQEKSVRKGTQSLSSPGNLPSLVATLKFVLKTLTTLKKVNLIRYKWASPTDGALTLGKNSKKSVGLCARKSAACRRHLTTSIISPVFQGFVQD